jgi:hypothetical protein
VVIGLNSVASNLLVGTYSATVWFTNLTDQVGQERQFTLAVLSPPSITGQPTNQAVLDGATAIFAVSATGGQPLYYQWQYNSNSLIDGGNISGSTTPNLIISNVFGADVGYYSVIVSNAAGTAISSNVLLTIIPSLPVITQEPADVTVGLNGTARFAVVAVGTKPFVYQWTLNTTNITGATNATLTLTNVQFTDAGTYSVEITNIYGATLSSNANLTVLPCDPAPSGLVSWWPGEGNANDAVGVNHGVLVNGSYINGEVGQAFNLNATNAYVKIPASPSLNVGLGAGMTVEGWIDPSAVNTERPILDWDNGNSWGTHFYISVSSSPYGTGPGCLYADFTDTGGSFHYLSSAPGLVQANVYQHVAFTYDKSSGAAVIYLNGVVVAQTNLGTNFTPQTSYDLYLGSTISNPSQASQWAGLDEMSLYNRALSSNEITAIYTAGSGGKCPPGQSPVITMQPTNETVLVGQTAGFVVAATGTLPLSYQWRLNTTNIAGATNVSLILANVQLTNAGNYSVRVTNSYGSITSSNALLTVLVPAVVITQPTNQAVYVGETASFVVTASGTLPLGYQWYFNQTNIANATNAILMFTNAQLNQAGNYKALVTNLVNSVLSSNAVLTVNLPPALGAVPSGNYLYVFWPLSAPGFVLETTPSLSPADWLIVSNPPAQIGGVYIETIQMTGSNEFFRLQLNR